MSEVLIKNVEHAAPFELINLVEYETGKIVSLTLAQEKGTGITVFAFDAEEKISTHAASGDAMAVILEGEAEITIDGKKYIAKTGEGIVMPAGIPHGVKAITRFKMLLTVVKR
ncbi:cupin domain-containing protein [Konateibacter massiliensis]|uniref:cupin domain-containing protein n=1 Tax=Konateibacter massiliensis TaxID=2002841 RepID=UPI000C15F307|nr:cupin domain-containing protein [Konateibacter massiliensis]